VGAAILLMTGGATLVLSLADRLVGVVTRHRPEDDGPDPADRPPRPLSDRP
jgi:hypothetical protein